MPKNNIDQAPKIRSIGEKNSDILDKDRVAWGIAMRPHELETIFANCLDSRAFAQYKVMMFLTGCAEEKFDVSLKNVMNRCGLSKDAYYKARAALINRGWLSMEESDNKVYITIHYNKIYQDGKECTSLNYTDEGNCKTYTDESNCENTTDIDEGKSENYTDVEECNFNNYTDNEGNCKNTTDEGKSENYTLEEGNCKTYSEGNCKTYYEGKLQKSQYNIDTNNIDNTITERDLEEEFDKVWNNAPKSRLTGAAAMF